MNYDRYFFQPLDDMKCIGTCYQCDKSINEDDDYIDQDGTYFCDSLCLEDYEDQIETEEDDEE